MPVFAKFDGVDGESTDKSNDDAFVFKSWSTSGDADDRPTEEVAFYYNKIAASYHKVAASNLDKSSTKFNGSEGDGTGFELGGSHDETYVEWTY